MLSTIEKGSVGYLVKVAKYLTNYSVIKAATDVFDESFKDHVVLWQTKNKLNADGVIGEKTWTKMFSMLPTCSTSKNKKSVYVCALQILLGNLTVDGVFGPNTKSAVCAYQSACKLTVDGICGPKTWASFLGETKTPIVIGEKPVDYKQYDSRWGSIKYSTHTSSQTISNSGCGPTSMADIVATWWDKSVTPKEMCALALANGYRTYNSGTAWGFFEFCAKKYKAYKYIETTSIATLKKALQDGAYAIVSFAPSKWTKSGLNINGLF